MAELEVYDHLEGKETLVIYMAKSGEGRIRLSGGLLTQDRETRILRDAYDYRPVHQRQVKIGERLMCSATVGGGGLQTRRILPTDWVVTEVETYEPSADIPGFREVIIAYCERKPLSLAEFKAAIYDNNVKVSVDSFGGDEKAYQEFLKSQSAKGYVQV
ncbi:MULTISPECIES: hypothetical protein [unclassified Coleofasciculus]|uniref:hypothetical protein n=1 Tax=unclassified Coleofasciculus TaxID=2692782 RepID=UPI0018828C65|nr:MULTISPECIES: hypothetical protein [unclassified Coleofasciculus]MBE9125450.1 hypothetical protein [Coleofasciculus sp. LEGE 07081]MBE9147136.1 hypothetical protein [Coleofasciculus sp. LEGE 07092]